MHIEDSRNETSSVKKMKSVRSQKAKAELKDRTVKQRKNFGIFSFFTGAGFLNFGFKDAGFNVVMADEVIR